MHKDGGQTSKCFIAQMIFHLFQIWSAEVVNSQDLVSSYPVQFHFAEG